MSAPNFVSDEQLPHYRKAGKIAAQALLFGAERIKPGVKVVDVLDRVEDFIREQGAEPAFPAQISINETAAHFCPDEDDETAFTDKDIVKIDVGVHIEGCIGDNAMTVDLTPDKKFTALIAASKEARDAAIALIRPGITPHELGTAVHAAITARGFSPIKNLSGHGLGSYQVHTAPSIPNYPNNDHTPLDAGHVIAIEPFATTGAGAIFNSSNPTIFSQVRPGRVRSPSAREALKIIEGYNGLPFTTRWISRIIGKGKARLALRELSKAAIIHEYPPLPEKGHGMVSQSEHTVLIQDKPEILTKP